MFRLKRVLTMESLVVGQAERIPWGWGAVGDGFVNDRRTYLPIPLNWVVTKTLDVWRRLQHPEPYPTATTYVGLVLQKEAAYARGYRYGFEDAGVYYEDRATRDVRAFLAVIANDYPMVHADLMQRWANLQKNLEG